MNMRKRSTIIFLVLLLSVASVGLVAAMIIPSAEELLTNAAEALEGITSGHAVREATAE
jgi:predicted PurR-regulated permease PerM